LRKTTKGRSTQGVGLKEVVNLKGNQKGLKRNFSKARSTETKRDAVGKKKNRERPMPENLKMWKGK